MPEDVTWRLKNKPIVLHSYHIFGVRFLRCSNDLWIVIDFILHCLPCTCPVRHGLYNVSCVSLYSGLINHWPILLYCTYYRIFRTIVRLVITPIQGVDGKSVSSVLFVRTRLVNLYSYNNQQQPCIQMHHTTSRVKLWRYQYQTIFIYTRVRYYQRLTIGDLP
jgi:hypothetical protein